MAVTAFKLPAIIEHDPAHDIHLPQLHRRPRSHHGYCRARCRHPRASTGNCYEPGEFCPHADEGMTGIAGDGEAIICEDNNGLRWEPA